MRILNQLDIVIPNLIGNPEKKQQLMDSRFRGNDTWQCIFTQALKTGVIDYAYNKTLVLFIMYIDNTKQQKLLQEYLNF